MKTIKLSSLVFLIAASIISGCDNLFVRSSKFDCNYTFLQCENGKVENSYKDHRARVQRVTGANALPPPYDQEIYIINLDPDSLNDKSSLPTGKRNVIPCGELPKEFQKDKIEIIVSGDQMDCYKVLASSPFMKVGGNAIFKVKSIKNL